MFTYWNCPERRVKFKNWNNSFSFSMPCSQTQSFGGDWGPAASSFAARGALRSQCTGSRGYRELVWESEMGFKTLNSLSLHKALLFPELGAGFRNILIPFWFVLIIQCIKYRCEYWDWKHSQHIYCNCTPWAHALFVNEPL